MIARKFYNIISVEELEIEKMITDKIRIDLHDEEVIKRLGIQATESLMTTEVNADEDGVFTVVLSVQYNIPSSILKSVISELRKGKRNAVSR
jgi:hypothetical protein